MPWLKLLHISAVIVWCGAVLYLPILMMAVAQPAARASTVLAWQLPRTVFIGVATPAALLAIGSGTLLFVTNGLVAPWLMVKLGAVALLVLGHAVCGMLVLRAERGEHRNTRVICTGLTVSMSAAMLVVAWLVLYKPT